MRFVHLEYTVATDHRSLFRLIVPGLCTSAGLLHHAGRRQRLQLAEHRSDNPVRRETRKHQARQLSNSSDVLKACGRTGSRLWRPHVYEQGPAKGSYYLKCPYKRARFAAQAKPPLILSTRNRAQPKIPGAQSLKPRTLSPITLSPDP